jgi:phosphopantetheine adenylyltransferase/dephospho-CoA kinase
MFKNCSSTRVVVGVTSTNMLQKKLLSEFIGPTEERIAGVVQFLRAVRSDLQADVVAITDPVGPAGTDALLQCIVVSEETKSAVPSINTLRQDRGLTTIDSLCIPLLPSVSLAEQKMSSSEQRESALGMLRPLPWPVVSQLFPASASTSTSANPPAAAASSALSATVVPASVLASSSSSSSSPSTTTTGQQQPADALSLRRALRRAPAGALYIIGLTGGIASGKSAVAKDLEGE